MSVRPRAALVATGLVAALLALASCGFSADDGESGGAGEAPAIAPAQPDAAGGGEPDANSEEQRPAGQDGAADDSGGTGGGALVDARAIIFTGTITLRVEDVAAAAGQATAIANRYGGFVGADERSTIDEGTRATMVLRIPSEQFTPAVSDLGQLGEEESRHLKTEDVTEEVVDVGTRIATAEASVERTRALLDRAESISDIVALEEELSQREGELASLQARQRTLEDLTTLSTITVTLLPPEAPLVKPEPEEPAETGFLVGLRKGWDGFVKTVTVLLTAVGWLLPWLVAIGAPIAAALWWSRRRRGAQPVTPAPVTAPEPAAAQAGGPPPAQA